MSDQSDPGAAVNPDPAATANNLFVSATDTRDDQPVPGGGSVMKITDLQGKKFVLRANHQDMELTPEELQTAAQKGLGFDELTTKHGQLKQELEPLANNWKAWQEAMTNNPGAALAAYAQQHGLTVGSINKDGYFEQVDPASDPVGGDTQSSSPEVKALTDQVNELKGMLGQIVGAVANSGEEQELTQKYNATPDELAKARQVAEERNLPPGSLELALSYVRQSAPPQQENSGTPAVPAVEGAPTSDVEALLQLLKAGNPQLSGGGNGTSGSPAKKPYNQMTPDERTKSAWEESKRELGIRVVNPTS